LKPRTRKGSSPQLFAADPDRLARFQREAQVLASLNHPNIATIYGLEDAGGVTALILELVEGETLAEHLVRLKADTPGSGAVESVVSGFPSAGLGTGSRTGIPIDEALTIARQIAEALEAAHERGTAKAAPYDVGEAAEAVPYDGDGANVGRPLRSQPQTTQSVLFDIGAVHSHLLVLHRAPVGEEVVVMLRQEMS
jgi:serine/threonine protein kinase